MSLSADGALQAPVWIAQRRVRPLALTHSARPWLQASLILAATFTEGVAGRLAPCGCLQQQCATVNIGVLGEPTWSVHDV